MDAAGIDVQVLSLNSPGVEQAADQIALAAEANDFVADAIGRHPDRFPAFAVLPPQCPKRRPPSRSVVSASRGSQEPSSTATVEGGIWTIRSSGRECAVSLEVPVHFHPTVPPKAMVDAS
jgi:hypothetical protein